MRVLSGDPARLVTSLKNVSIAIADVICRLYLKQQQHPKKLMGKTYWNFSDPYERKVNKKNRGAGVIQGCNAITTPVPVFAPLGRLPLQPPPHGFQMVVPPDLYPDSSRSGKGSFLRPWANTSFRLTGSGLQLDMGTGVCV